MKQFRFRSLLVALIMLVGAAAGASAQTQRHEKSLGITAGYATHNRSASAGLAFDYAFSSHFVIAPSVDIILPHHGLSAGVFNLDFRVPLRFTSPSSIEFFPLVGVNFNSWQYSTPDSDDPDRSSNLGLNLGAGLQWRLTPTLKLYILGRQTFTRDNPNASFLVGISRVF